MTCPRALTISLFVPAPEGWYPPPHPYPLPISDSAEIRLQEERNLEISQSLTLKIIALA